MSEPRPASLTPEYQRDWPKYFDAVADKPPRDTLIRALDAIAADASAPASALALDIACGEGRDTREMLRRAKPRWRVIAADSHPEAVHRTFERLEFEDITRTAVCQIAMEALPSSRQVPPAVDLINASFALPFCEPDAFPALWAWIVRTLRSGGRFAGQFFGERDEWAAVRPYSHHTRAQVLELLQPFAVEHMEEVEKQGDDAMGGTKYHHVFHIVAQTLTSPVATSTRTQ